MGKGLILTKEKDMEIKGKVHCFFEQSGTFKNEFIKLGIPAEDYDIALKMTAVVQIKGLRMIIENPWHPTNFTNHFFFLRASLIDKDRTRRGDYFRKPTAYWYVNCQPTYGETMQQTPRNEIKKITAGSGAAKTKRKLAGKFDKKQLDSEYIEHKSSSGICDEDRSLISSDYARNFICDFVL